MPYFDKFPAINYKMPGSTSSRRIINLTASSKIVDILANKSQDLFVDYIIKDGERPEHIAERVYGKSEYHWVILLSNQIVNPYFDWPLSTDDLNSQIDDLYTGISVFVGCVPSSIQFKINGSQTYLPAEESHFVVGNTVTQVQNATTITGTIKSWDPTFRKLEIIDIESSNASVATFTTAYAITSDNINDVTFTVDPIRIVYDNSETVHHFEDDFGNWLDPFAKVNPQKYSDGKIYSTSSFFLDNDDGLTITTVNDFPLNRYITRALNVNVVTNRQYEYNINDAKRNVKILKIELLDRIIEQLNTVFKT